MLSKKYAIGNLRYLVLMWFMLVFGFGFPSILFISLLKAVTGEIPLPNLRDPIIFGLISIIYFALQFIWRKSTFRRGDFLALGKKMGVKFTNTLYYFSPLDIIGVYSFARGFLDNISVVAKIDFPFFAYAPFKRISGFRDGRVVLSGGDTPDYMLTESRVELFSLINGPFDIDMTIKIGDVKRDVPTSISEIDSILNNTLKDVDYFHARLIFNTDCLRMSIIGGSWEGRRFGEKILTGFEVFRRLNSALKVKYPLGDWKDWQVKLNRKDEEFYLEPTGKS